MTGNAVSFAQLDELLERQLVLCDLLETIADALPVRLDFERCRMAGRLVVPLLREAHAAEEAVLFPRLVAQHPKGAALVQRLRLDHLEDECFGEEVQYELHQLACRQEVIAPEATGYMLRGFFECLRRHVRHDRDLLDGFAPDPAVSSPAVALPW